MAANKLNKKQNQQQQQTQKSSQAQQIQHQTGKKQKHKQGKQVSIAQKSNSSSNCCPWLFGIFIVIGSIAAAITYDVHKNGNGVFERSATGKLLKDTGALPYIEIATQNTLHYSARGFQWAEVNVPVYYSKTKEIITPYVLFSRDLAKVAWNNFQILYGNFCEIVSAKYIILCKYIEQHAPGLAEKIETAIKISWEFVTSMSKVIYHSSVNFFKTNVFIGQLSPESLSEKLNQSQQWASEYYSWFHKKVDMYAQIKSS